MSFVTDYPSIVAQIEKIDPVRYAKSRNFVDGAVTKLSPYISRGVISLTMLKEHALKNHQPFQIEKFLQELAWREYWQRVWQAKGDALFTDLKNPQTDVAHHQLSTAIQQANTGIETIDQHIEGLYQTGYLHNHLRMYIASICCNVGKAHWLTPSKWMYYHLLDGDLASNSLSWQWVAGAFSSKKYYCNQENINKYTYSRQRKTFLDRSYEEIPELPVPSVLEAQEAFDSATILPLTPLPEIDPNLPVLVYNSYNLDPLWHSNLPANRILLLEPDHFNQFPVSSRVLDFIIALSSNIPDIQIYTGSFANLQSICDANQPIHFKQHPAFTHYRGKSEQPQWLFPEVSGYFPSFFGYWKKCERWI